RLDLRQQGPVLVDLLTVHPCVKLTRSLIHIPIRIKPCIRNYRVLPSANVASVGDDQVNTVGTLPAPRPQRSPQVAFLPVRELVTHYYVGIVPEAALCICRDDFQVPTRTINLIVIKVQATG